MKILKERDGIKDGIAQKTVFPQLFYHWHLMTQSMNVIMMTKYFVLSIHLESMKQIAQNPVPKHSI